jgi:hypothetical protein
VTTITDKKLKHTTLLILKKWYSLAENGELMRAKGQAQIGLNICKSVIKCAKLDVDTECRNKALVIGILFHGLKDFIELAETTCLPGWETKNELIEKAWEQMWDCRDRIEYASNFCHAKILDWVFSKIKSLEEYYLNRFGHGFYFSPEIFIKRELCSICNNDFRSCEHITNGIYNGVRCVVIPQDFEPRSVSIVTVPEDPRCRIWPWKIKENRIAQSCIMSFFRIDDFVYEL